MELYPEFIKEMEEYAGRIADPELKKMFRQCFSNTLSTTTELMDDGTTYVFTGDIPAMWLRDSAAQVSPYLPLCKTDFKMRRVIKGMINRQMRYITVDPYANAFNMTADGSGHKDITKQNDLVFERKYEIDSLCYPVWIAKRYYDVTGDAEVFGDSFVQGAKVILETLKKEQRHDELSDYSFMRTGEYYFDSLDREGKGSPTAYTGMTWSGFRPSDDRCVYHYLIPDNQFAAVVTEYLATVFTNVIKDAAIAKAAAELSREIREGVEKYGVAEHPEFGKIYAFEVDGLGGQLFMDDANVPGLLSLPYLGYCGKSDPVYLNTRKFILSKSNPYYFEGTAATGIGSPHTPKNYIWHIALIMQALTSDSITEKTEIIKTLRNTHAGTFYMHEGFDKDNPSKFTRSWFAWANSLFSVLVMQNIELLSEKFNIGSSKQTSEIISA